MPAPGDVDGYIDIAEAHGVDLTVVGPEAPLVAGIVDQFRARGLRIVGPSQAAARLEGSKLFAKKFFERARYSHGPIRFAPRPVFFPRGRLKPMA